MTLTDMLDELRAEAGISQNVAHGATLNAGYKQLLRRVQEELILAHDWPHLRIVATKAVVAGNRYLEYPENVELDGILQVRSKPADGTWENLEYGIGIEQLELHDSDSDERSDQVQRWQHYMQPTGNTNHNMFEIWPIPDQSHTLRFEAKHKPYALIDGADETTIDGPAIVLHAAAQLLARTKAEDAGLKLDMGKTRVRDLLRRQTAADTRQVNMAQDGPSAKRWGSPRFPTE
jgi:hypothetical protein